MKDPTKLSLAEAADIVRKENVKLRAEVAQLKLDKEALIAQRDEAYRQKDAALLQLSEARKAIRILLNYPGVRQHVGTEAVGIAESAMGVVAEKEE